MRCEDPLRAMVLVTLVVFIFLQNWRTTLIPCWRTGRDHRYVLRAHDARFEINLLRSLPWCSLSASWWTMPSW